MCKSIRMTLAASSRNSSTFCLKNGDSLGYASEGSPVISVRTSGGSGCAPVFSSLALLFELASSSVLEVSGTLGPLVCPTQHPEDKTGQF